MEQFIGKQFDGLGAMAGWRLLLVRIERDGGREIAIVLRILTAVSGHPAARVGALLHESIPGELADRLAWESDFLARWDPI